MRKTVLALAAVGMVGALAGCTNPFSGDPQAGMNSGQNEVSHPATVIEFPKTYRNIAIECDGTTRIYEDPDQVIGDTYVINSPECGAPAGSTPIVAGARPSTTGN